MYHFLYIFTVLTLCTLPTFGATNSGSKNNEFSFSIKGKFTGDTNYSPDTGPRAKITSPSTCNFDLYKGQTSFNLTTEFDSSITCPAGTNSITLEFTPDNSTAGISPKHKIQNPTHTINLTKTKKNYKLPDIVLVQTNKTASATQTSSVQKIGNDQSEQEQSRLERTGFQKFCEDEGYKDETGNSSLGEIDATCNKYSNDSQIYFYCYKYKNSPIPEYEIRKHFAYYCFTNKTTPVNPQQKQRPNSHKKPKTCPKITPAWKNQNNAVSGACDTETGELYITECKRDYVGATRGIGKEGYKSCTPSNLTKIGENVMPKTQYLQNMPKLMVRSFANRQNANAVMI